MNAIIRVVLAIAVGLASQASARTRTDIENNVIKDSTTALANNGNVKTELTTYAICNSPANPRWLIVWLYDGKFSIDASDTSLERALDVTKQVNLRVNSYTSFASMKVTVVLNVATGAASGAMSFFSKTADSTAWLSVVMQEPALVDGRDCFTDGSNTGLCQSSFFSLPSALWTSAHGFYCDSARTSCTFSDLSPADVVFAPSALADAISRKKRFVNTQLPQQSGYQWALITSGCSPPQFTFEVRWSYSPNAGQPPTSLAYNEQQRIASGGRRLMGFGDQECWRRTVTLVAIGERPGFDCVMPTTSNLIRAMAPGTAVASVQTLQYARDATDSAAFVLMSAMQAGVLVGCAAPTSFRKWSSWSTTGPGVCTSCTTYRSSTQHMRAVACDAEQSKTADCCFTCVDGYISYRPSPTEETVCVKACALGQFMAGGVCQACPEGKFSYSRGLDSQCKTCAELGYPNAYPGRFECVKCGTRFQVEPLKGLSCVACDGKQYVPPGESVCRKCASGTVLSSSSSDCTRCPQGTYHHVARDVCLTCPTDFFMNATGATACVRCPPGTRAAPGRTACVPCPALDNRSNSEYVPGVGGCDAVRCQRGFYPAAAGMCEPCSSLTIPVGTYRLTDNCATTVPCTNAPAGDPNVVYTGWGYAFFAGGGCDWGCRDGTGTYRPLSGIGCVPCIIPGFNASIHMWTTACNYVCARGRYTAPGAPLSACQTLCTDLSLPSAAWPGPIFLRLRNYTAMPAGFKRPYYQHGVCGASEGLPTSEIPFLNLGRFALYSAASLGWATLCGNSLLNQNEQCDDGNRVDGDGCDATCQLEKTGKWWDCDLIGRPCLPLCGWSLTQQTQWGVGLAPTYVLPTSAANDCRGVSYFDFMQIPLADQGQWLENNLVSCLCVSNPMRTVPYEECTAENEGCRQCPTGWYHDDLRGRCARCGSVCALGFTSSAPAACSVAPGEPTQRTDRQRIEAEQLELGCVPCPIPAVNDYSHLVFATFASCAFSCLSPSRYCYPAPAPGITTCAGGCFSCQDSLGTAITQLATKQQGHYIGPCVDGEGHQVLPCDESSLPKYASFIGNAPDNAIGDSKGCPYSCKANAELIDGACIPCVNGALTCKNGEKIYTCTGSTRRFCYQCSRSRGAPPPLEMWYSNEDFSDCYSDCEAGLAFSPEQGQACTLCTEQRCSLGQLYTPCEPRADAFCSPCPDNSLLPNQEFVVAGSCATRCVSGFAFSGSGTSCVSCASMADLCSSDEVPASDCSDPADRNRLPLCVKCPPPPAGAGRLSRLTCSFKCLQGFFATVDNSTRQLTCTKCENSMCPLGTRPACDGGPLKCAPCPIQPPQNGRFSAATAGSDNCAIGCNAGFVLAGFPPNVICSPLEDGGGENGGGGGGDNGGSTPRPPPPRLDYPRRRIPHS